MGGKVSKKHFENVSDVFIINGYQMITLKTVLASCNVLHKYLKKNKDTWTISSYFAKYSPIGIFTETHILIFFSVFYGILVEYIICIQNIYKYRKVETEKIPKFLYRSTSKRKSARLFHFASKMLIATFQWNINNGLLL